MSKVKKPLRLEDLKIESCYSIELNEEEQSDMKQLEDQNFELKQKIHEDTATIPISSIGIRALIVLSGLRKENDFHIRKCATISEIICNPKMSVDEKTKLIEKIRKETGEDK